MGGFVAPGFEAVQAAFSDNLVSRDELGAAFAATVDGQLVVDLWGGLADADALTPWEAETPVVIFSGTKGLVALCLLVLADRGQLALDAPVSTYWPEFAAAGKKRITVAEIASHRARLPAFREPLEPGDFLDDRRMAELLAAQAPDPDPRASGTYHGFTYGWLCGELVRRVDGRSVGRFFADEVAAPLGLRAWIGLPDEMQPEVATLCFARDWGVGKPQWDLDVVADDPLMAALSHNPPVLRPGEPIVWNRPEFRSAEIPGAGGVATARSMARLYGCLARGGELDGVRLLSEETLARGCAVLVKRRDTVWGRPCAYGVGFQLQTELHELGKPEDAFGHGGAGGSIHGAWPSHRVGFSYAMNVMRDDEQVDPRAQALLTALHDAVESHAGGTS